MMEEEDKGERKQAMDFGKDNMEPVEKRVREAFGRIESLRKLREGISAMGRSDNGLDQMVGLLRRIEDGSRAVLSSGFKARASVLSSGSGSLSSLVRGMVNGVESGTSAIVDSATSMVASVARASASVTSTATKAAENTAKAVVDVSKSAASSMVSAAGDVSSSLVGQTANLASSLASSASTVVSKVGNMSGKAAQAAVDGILNPSDGQGVKSLVSGTADLASSLVQSTGTAANTLVSEANGIASTLLGNASDIVGSATGGLKKGVYDFASALIGGQSSAVVDAVFGGSVPEPVNVKDIGGLFGAAT